MFVLKKTCFGSMGIWDTKSQTHLCKPLICAKASLPIYDRSPAVAEKVDRTAYDALINHHLDNNTLPRM